MNGRCQMFMSSAAIAALKRISIITLFLCAGVHPTSASCLQYGGVHALDGMLRTEAVVPFEGQGPTTYAVLEFEAPLCMQADPAALENGAVSNIKKLQIIPPRERGGDYQILVGQKVTVRGVLVAATSAHHVLPLLLDAQSIAPISPAAAAFPAFWGVFYHAALERQCDRLVHLADLPLQTYGSLDSDPIELLDTAAFLTGCKPILESEDALIRDIGAYPPADWRTAAAFEDQARLGDFEFHYGETGWRWAAYYR